jgi:hypothetical protein
MVRIRRGLALERDVAMGTEPDARFAFAFTLGRRSLEWNFD